MYCANMKTRHGILEQLIINKSHQTNVMYNNIVTSELHVLVLPNCHPSAYNRCIYCVRELTKLCSSWV